MPQISDTERCLYDTVAVVVAAVAVAAAVVVAPKEATSPFKWT